MSQDIKASKSTSEKKEAYTFDIHYKNGNEEIITTSLTESELNNQINVIGSCYKEDQTGFLLIDGAFIRISETYQITIKKVSDNE